MILSRHLFILLSVFIALGTDAHAYSSYGLGNLDCAIYLQRRAEDQQNHTLENTSYIHAYLSGYLTAGNMMKGLVGDSATDVSINIHRFVQWLDAKCTEKEQIKVAVALEEFWVEAARAKEIKQGVSPAP
ncbi:MAG: hypothetical protein ACU84Q_04515 [Gammaproteobacteria bacterium]